MASDSDQPRPAPPPIAATAPTGLRAMVVEDEVPLAALMGSYLERSGFDVTIVHDGLDAVERARQVDPDVVVLDLGLPRLDGIEVCRRLRTFSDAYVIMLTARAEEVDTLVGLSVGADDYMTKPFSPRELVARIQAMLRRPRTSSDLAASAVAPKRRVFGPLTIDPAGREVRIDETLIALTRTEFDVLATLSEHPNVVFSRAQLIAAVWGPSWIGDEHLVDVHIGICGANSATTPLAESSCAPCAVSDIGWGRGSDHDASRTRTHTRAPWVRVRYPPAGVAGNRCRGGCGERLAGRGRGGTEIVHKHLQQAGIAHAQTETAHVERAFTSAMILSLAIALMVSVLIALAVSWYFTRRVQRSITEVAASASEIASGQYTARLTGVGLGREFDQLAETFNQLADRLDSVETTRRRMLSDLAHEMRTPLATLDAHLEALEDGLRLPDTQTFAILRSSTARLARLAEDITAVSRAQEGRLANNPVHTDTRASSTPQSAATPIATLPRTSH